MNGRILRPGDRGDAVTVAALATQVFLDTYATDGVRPDLAREAFHHYSEQAFLARLADPARRFVLAEMPGGLVGFAELGIAITGSPAPAIHGCELVRLYVQPRSQRAGVGSALLAEGETLARAAGASHLWLTVWEGNLRALAFYSRLGYADVGSSTHALEGRAYGNRVVARRLAHPARTP